MKITLKIRYKELSQKALTELYLKGELSASEMTYEKFKIPSHVMKKELKKPIYEQAVGLLTNRELTKDEIELAISSLGRDLVSKTQRIEMSNILFTSYDTDGFQITVFKNMRVYSFWYPELKTIQDAVKFMKKNRMRKILKKMNAVLKEHGID